MEPMNFYKNGSPEQHKAIARWFCISCLLLATGIISLAGVQLHQWYTSNVLSTEKNIITAELQTFDHIIQQQQSQKVLQAQLETKMEKIAQQSKQQKNPAELLKIIKASLKNNTSIESLAYYEKNIELKIAGEKTKTLLQCAEVLGKNSAFANLCITSLESKEKNRFIATLKNE